MTSKELKALNRYQKWALKPKEIKNNFVVLDDEGIKARDDFFIVRKGLIELDKLRDELDAYKKAIDDLELYKKVVEDEVSDPFTPPSIQKEIIKEALERARKELENERKRNV